jgi:hypothetical protein
MAKETEMDRSSVIRWLSLALVASLLTACGEDSDGEGATRPESTSTGLATTVPVPGGTDAGGGTVAGACDLTEPEVVASVFGGTASEEPGIAQNCSYALQGGTVDQVEVYYYGTGPAWDGVRQGYADNRGPLTDIAGVGSEAFHPGDVGELELVVLAGDVVFAVGLGIGLAAPNDVGDRVQELAQLIAADLA